MKCTTESLGSPTQEALNLQTNALGDVLKEIWVMKTLRTPRVLRCVGQV